MDSGPDPDAPGVPWEFWAGAQEFFRFLGARLTNLVGAVGLGARK